MCPFRCPYCCSRGGDITNIGDLTGHIASVPTLRVLQILEEEKIDCVSFCGYGEPTMCPNIDSALCILLSTGIRVEFLTQVTNKSPDWWESTIRSCGKSCKLLLLPSVHFVENNVVECIKLFQRVEKLQSEGFDGLEFQPLFLIDKPSMANFVKYYDRYYNRFNQFWKSGGIRYSNYLTEEERNVLIDRYGDRLSSLAKFEDVETRDIFEPVKKNLCHFDLNTLNLEVTKDGKGYMLWAVSDNWEMSIIGEEPI